MDIAQAAIVLSMKRLDHRDSLHPNLKFGTGPNFSLLRLAMANLTNAALDA
jgi:hypothetical protein